VLCLVDSIFVFVPLENHNLPVPCMYIIVNTKGGCYAAWFLPHMIWEQSGDIPRVIASIAIICGLP
jgi:hypothetical protein